MIKALGVLLLLIVGSATAAPVVWTLNGVTFDDGGTASGSFTFDTSTGIYSDIGIQTTAGLQSSGASFGYLNNSTTVGQDLLLFETGTGASGLALDWQGNLSNQGGNFALKTGGFSYEILLQTFTGREVTEGSISAIPVPAAVWLFGSALAGLGWFRRRQTV